MIVTGNLYNLRNSNIRKLMFEYFLCEKPELGSVSVSGQNIYMFVRLRNEFFFISKVFKLWLNLLSILMLFCFWGKTSLHPTEIELQEIFKIKAGQDWSGIVNSIDLFKAGTNPLKDETVKFREF